MIAVIQRVSSSNVKVEGKIVGEIGCGLNILLGVKKGDTKEDIKKLISKIVNLRIFQDKNDKMNLSLLDTKGEVLIISQFTLAANIKKGRRPSFDSSENPELAKKLYEEFIEEMIKEDVKVQTGIFGAKMDVNIQNDGPVTFIVDSKELN
ncbi:D-aminoacyl-tRNA deacylase [Halarcobacter ebronensis]|uniref:D-aminoacyl-tRNA deacylase n=1 Tax=Halarcobacter ebronensis TaxID=1462615 RepID=A0A4Q1AL48_9BACT|nr:D-aminoacyl-tRNA deacylase [Halarcobacter ebronensis]QKF83267.1 D-aminoacyl-tRNA deacylase [Halarcobacter ebronensis]RXK05831.1 D-tyrosyl-tRNA(Tyr) deacylase [Halarcobacter ebronensis]